MSALSGGLDMGPDMTDSTTPSSNVTIAVWQEPKGWYWDDTEDHGGYDRISPHGPFASEELAKRDAQSTFVVPQSSPVTIKYQEGRPDHYPTQMPPVPPVLPAKAKRERPKSRPQRWADAVGACLGALDVIGEQLDAFENACSELRAVQEEYEDWKSNLPDGLASSPVGDKLEAVCDLDIEGGADSVRTAIDEVRGVIEEAENIDLPRGFGKD